jgi:hypothetical protein
MFDPGYGSPLSYSLPKLLQAVGQVLKSPVLLSSPPEGRPTPTPITFGPGVELQQPDGVHQELTVQWRVQP